MKILSISDVITNSSSEVFILHAKPEFQDEINQEIPEFLKEVCNLFEEDIEDMLYTEISDETYIDEEWYYYVHKNDLIIHSNSDNTIPQWLMEIIDNLPWTKKFRDKFQGYYAEDLGEIDLPYYDWNHKPDEPALKHRMTEIKSIQRHHLG
jgi:hypothetical protein